MRIHDKHFSDASVTYIETDASDSPAMSRTEYEHLRELARALRVQQDQPTVALSLSMFERMLQVIAVGLLHVNRD